MRLTQPETAILQTVCGYARQCAVVPEAVEVCAGDARHLLRDIAWYHWQYPALKHQCADACRQMIAAAERPAGTSPPDFGPLADALWATARRLGFDHRWVQEVAEEMPNS
jgi:hypothetical protein